MTTWTVPAVVVRVVDGDTVRLTLDLGFDVAMTKNCRVLGVNAPETDTVAGKLARDFAREQLPAGLALLFVSHRIDLYGRPLGRLMLGVKRDVDFSAVLLAAGHAVAVKY